MLNGQCQGQKIRGNKCNFETASRDACRLVHLGCTFLFGYSRSEINVVISSEIHSTVSETGLSSQVLSELISINHQL